MAQTAMLRDVDRLYRRTVDALAEERGVLVEWVDDPTFGGDDSLGARLRGLDAGLSSLKVALEESEIGTWSNH